MLEQDRQTLTKITVTLREEQICLSHEKQPLFCFALSSFHYFPKLSGTECAELCQFFVTIYDESFALRTFFQTCCVPSRLLALLSGSPKCSCIWTNRSLAVSDFFFCFSEAHIL